MAPEAFEASPRGPFSLGFARDRFGGWPPLGEGPDAPLVAAFPVEGWRTSAAVVVGMDGGHVRGEVFGAGTDAEHAWRQVLAALSLDFDGSGFSAVGARDAVVGEIQKRYGWGRPICNFSPYEGGVQRVLGQRSSIQQARRLREALAEAAGEAIEVGGRSFRAFPAPQRLLELKTFRGVSVEKLARLHALARAALDGLLERERLRSLPVERALEQLAAIRGVGEWTAQGILMRGAGLVDEVTDDEATRQAVRFAYGLKQLPTQPEVIVRAEAWRPYRMWVEVLLHLHLRNAGPGLTRGRR